MARRMIDLFSARQWRGSVLDEISQRRWKKSYTCTYKENIENNDDEKIAGGKEIHRKSRFDIVTTTARQKCDELAEETTTALQ